MLNVSYLTNISMIKYNVEFKEESVFCELQGIQFIEKFTILVERLLEYQTEINDENIDNKINCTVNILVSRLHLKSY